MAEYNPAIHGKIRLPVAFKAECDNCGWLLDAKEFHMGDEMPPDQIVCPKCLLQGNWTVVRVVRTL